MAESADARNWHGLVRGAVRECLETWLRQAHAGPVTVEALEGILARSSVLLFRRLEGMPPEQIVELLPILIRTMLGSFVEAMEEKLAPIRLPTERDLYSRQRRSEPMIAHQPTITVLGIDLASGGWKNNGSAVLRFSTDPPAWIEVLPGAVVWPTGPLTPSGLAAAIDGAAIAHGAVAVSLDGPQGWRDPNAVSRRGVGRHCELLTQTPGKTGPYGTAYPRTMFSWITFCIDVFAALVRRPHVSLVNAPEVHALPCPAAGHYYVLECFPTSTWRTAELRQLPGKGQSTSATVVGHAAALRDRFKLPDFTTPGHDDLQAIVAALPAAGLLGAPCRAVARGVPGELCPPGAAHPAHWLEGLIWDAIPNDLASDRYQG